MPQDSEKLRLRWAALMESLGFPKSEETYSALISAYSEKQRAYHSLEHISACLNHLDVVKTQAENIHAIELALWFHDAIYKPFSSTNEEDSATWAVAFLNSAGASEDVIQKVSNLIILTKEHIMPETQDAKLMIDIDLSILGAKPHIYDQYEKDIRYEYKWVPKFIYKKKRKAILETFLARSKIYQTSYFNEKFENPARVNLSRAIAAL